MEKNGPVPSKPGNKSARLLLSYLQTLKSIRGERTWAIAIQTVLRELKFRTEFPYFSREKRPEFRRKRNLYEPLLTAMAQVLPFLKSTKCFIFMVFSPKKHPFFRSEGTGPRSSEPVLRNAAPDVRTILWKRAQNSRTKNQPKEEVFGTDIPWTSGGPSRGLSGPLNRLNAILSLLQPLDRFWNPPAIGSAIGRPLLALSRIQTQVGVLNRTVLNRSGGLKCAIVRYSV